MADSKHKQIFDQITTDLLTTSLVKVVDNVNDKLTAYPSGYIEEGGREPTNISFSAEDQNYPFVVHIISKDKDEILAAIEEIRSLWYIGTAKREVIRLLGVIDIAVVEVSPPWEAADNQILSGFVEFRLWIRYYP